MHVFPRSKLSVLLTLGAIVVVVGGLLVTMGLWTPAPSAHAAKASSTGMHLDCASGRPTCTEVYDSETVFGKDNYVGHDEPSTLFYSNRPGSGNQMRYTLDLPKDPSPSNPTTPGKSYNFELHPAFWFGMAMCDTQSYPDYVEYTCPFTSSAFSVLSVR